VTPAVTGWQTLTFRVAWVCFHAVWPRKSLAVPDPLSIYLTDHFAGATSGLELVRRCLRRNEGSHFAAPLSDLVREVEADRRALLAVMRRLGVEPSLLKTSAAWVLEKVARLKPNGPLLAYTPLDRVVELESLTLGIAGKRALWRALGDLSSSENRLAGADFNALAERAEVQLATAERLRREAARLAFAAEENKGETEV
jgi:hypothetical protein